MDEQKIAEVIEIYRNKLLEMGFVKRRFILNIPSPSFQGALNHCLSMLDEMEIFIQEGRMDKVFRWLGFVQGCLFTCGVYSVEELKDHNRPR